MRKLVLRMLGAFVLAMPFVFDGRAWKHAQGPDLEEDASRICFSVPGPLQTVQRAEYLGGHPCPAKTLKPLHLGIDNKNVCDKVGWLLNDWRSTPFCLCADGDSLGCISGMLRCRSQG